ncbi:MAG: SpoIIE family protein phosphatase [Bacteroidetes bacterium]|nr:SpoIIE family protein phosphatase [Bacteroidota bacterium]
MFELELQDQILNKLNTLIVVLNNDGSIDFVSKSAQQMLGYNSQDLLGLNWWEKTRFSKPEGELIKNKIVHVFKQNKNTTQTFEHELKTSIGGKKWVRWNISSLNNEQLIGIGYDVTESKLNEKRLIESNAKLSDKNKDITDSIYYAQRIQKAILQTQAQLKSIFSHSFLIYKPKDIVSGDYYWFYEDEKYCYAAVADCTGHGVPGAMMSMVAKAMFKEVFINKKITAPDLILTALDEELDKSIYKNNDSTFNDGMDVALIRIDKITNCLTYAGAFNSILILSNQELIELKGDRYPIGFYSGIEKNFCATTIQLKQNDCIYLFSDGYVDQFGGEKNKKLNKSNFKELLKTMNDMEIEEQEAFLEYSFNNWKQDTEQTDDVLVIGIKV